MEKLVLAALFFCACADEDPTPWWEACAVTDAGEEITGDECNDGEVRCINVWMQACLCGKWETLYSCQDIAGICGTILDNVPVCLDSNGEQNNTWTDTPTQSCDWWTWSYEYQQYLCLTELNYCYDQLCDPNEPPTQ